LIFILAEMPYGISALFLYGDNSRFANIDRRRANQNFKIARLDYPLVAAVK
jgi:hypothetical protein